MQAAFCRSRPPYSLNRLSLFRHDHRQRTPDSLGEP